MRLILELGHGVKDGGHAAPMRHKKHVATVIGKFQLKLEERLGR